MLQAIWTKIKTLDRFRRSVLALTPIALALLFFLLIAHPSDFFLSDWILNEWILSLIAVPACVGNLFAGSTYIARAWDAYSDDYFCEPEKLTDPSKPYVGKKERLGTLLGIILGLIIGVVLSALTPSLPALSSSLTGAAHALFTLSFIGSFAGLGNRLGGFCEQNRKLQSEKNAIAVAAVIGVIASIILLATSASALVTVVGVTSIFSAGAALPVWLAGAVFIGTFTGSLVSSADYFLKGINFLRAKCFAVPDPAVKKMVDEKPHEYRGSFTGITLGFIVAAIIITALAITQPHVLAGIVGVVAAIVIIPTCMSVLGGLCSRIGRFIDGVALESPVGDDADERGPLLNPESLEHEEDATTAPSDRLSHSQVNAYLQEQSSSSSPPSQVPAPSDNNGNVALPPSGHSVSYEPSSPLAANSIYRARRYSYPPDSHSLAKNDKKLTIAVAYT